MERPLHLIFREVLFKAVIFYNIRHRLGMEPQQELIVIKSLFEIMICLGHAPHGQDRQLESAADHDHHDHHGSADGLDSAVGISLVLGFIFMLLIDQVSVLQNSFSSSLTAALCKLEHWYLAIFLQVFNNIYDEGQGLPLYPRPVY
jgi:hypothetical protein